MNETKILEKLLDITNDVKDISKNICAQKEINDVVGNFAISVVNRFRIQQCIIVGLCIVTGSLCYRISKLEQKKK